MPNVAWPSSCFADPHSYSTGYLCRIDVVTKEDALDFLQTEENRQKDNK